jgi:tetratricopeptide (TPR) repeat protein
VGEVKSAFEKAMEKIAAIETLTDEEKQAIRDRDRLKSVLARFYKRELGADELFEELKGLNPALLKEAQEGMLGAVRLIVDPEEFRLRAKGILAVEALKASPHTPAAEQILTTVERLLKEYRDRSDQAIEELRQAMEQNPQLRMRPVQTPDGRTVMKATASVDEAVQARLSEYMEQLNGQYEEHLEKLMTQLRRELK